MPNGFGRLKNALADRYAIQHELGAGGMATVYLAEDLKHHRNVAVKVLRPDLAAALGAQRFLREIETTANLNHPHILPLFDSGEADGFLYYVMPHVEGESLRDRLDRENQLPLKEAVKIATEVADALDAAHEKGIVHRDIKPENILLERGHAVVADFGIARAISAVGASRITEAGLTIGTPLYMSPEQASGIDSVDGQSDLYSLGCVLYEMLVGEPPFTGTTAVSIMSQHVSEVPRPVTTARPAVPGGVAAAVQRVLSKSPADRFHSAAAFGAALNLPSASAPPAAPSHPRIRGPFAIRGAAVLILLLMVLVVWRPLSRGQQPLDSIAVLPLANLSGDPNQEYFADGMTDAVIENLGQIGSLRVISRTSVMPFKTTQLSLRDIGRTLDVAGIVEGTVRSSGGQVEITVRLFDAGTEERLWSARFARELQDALTLQQEVALAIVQEIAVQLQPGEQERLERTRSIDPEAHDLFLVGRHFRERDTLEDWIEAITYFERSIEQDSSFAPAHAWLAGTYVLVTGNGALPRTEGIDKARQAAQRALALDPMVPEAHVALGLVQEVFDWDWGAAERSFRLAVQANANYREAHRELGWLLTRLGRFDESLVEMRQALALDPASVLAHSSVIVPLYYGGWYDEAIAHAMRTIELDSTFSMTYLWLGNTYLQQNRFEESIAALEKAPRFYFAEAYLANAYAVTGMREEALRMLELWEEQWRQGEPVAWNIAAVYAGQGDDDVALDWLETAVEAREALLFHIKVDPHLARLHTDPRFQALLRTMGFE